MDSQNDVINHPVEHHARARGFLPIDTNWFDRFFIGVMGHVAFNLLWMRFFEPGFKSFPSIFGKIVLGIFWISVVVRKKIFPQVEDGFLRFLIWLVGWLAILLSWWILIEPIIPKYNLPPIPLIVATILGVLWIIYVIWKG
jgi:Predicted small integral membrane protein (DUF2160)